MAKFIKVHDHIINIESVGKVEYLHDDISLEYFPTDENGKIVIDYMPWPFAELELLTGGKIMLEIDLYDPEDGQTEDEWLERNKRIIKVSWDQLVNALGDVTKVTGYEYNQS